MTAPNGQTKQPQINAAVTDVVSQWAPSVKRIRYDIGEDWSGQGAIFFRVLLSNTASKPKNLREIGPKVIWRMSDRLYPLELGLLPYFHFRSEAEQATADEPAS